MNYSVLVLIALFPLLFALPGCHAEQGISRCGIPIIIGNREIEADIAKKLSDKSVPNERIDGVLCADSKSIDIVRQIIGTVVADYIKPGLSSSLHSSIHDAVVTKLKSEGIEFRELQFQGKKYLTWGSLDSKFVRSIIEEEKKKFIDSLM